MGYFLSVLFKTLRRNLFLFIFIVLVLVSGKWIRSEWLHIQSIVGELPALQRAEKDVSVRQAAVTLGIAQRVRQLSGATVQQLDEEIRALDNEISRLQGEQGNASMLSAALTGADSVAEQLRQAAMRGVDIELRRQQRQHLITLRAYGSVLVNRQAAETKLAQLGKAHVQVYAALQSAQQQLALTRAAAGRFAKIPFTPSSRQVRGLENAVKGLQGANIKAHRDFLAHQMLLKRLSPATAPAAFRVDERALTAAAAPLPDRLLGAQKLAAQNHLWQAYQAVRPVLPLALGVLVGWWLVPAAIRTFFYFVLAPHAARTPPIVIGTANRVAPASHSGQCASRDSALISALSQRVTLAHDHEILIRPDYCQSQPAGVNVTTKWLFSGSHWLTSIAAHLWMLKRLRTTQAAAIVVSATADALDEVALLEIAAGEALVLQPRGLVGMMYQTGQRPNIRSHWRLGTLHAWLTLQLRYLAFEGPATLFVKGCRGVRLESALTGRTVSQDATLGFSANASYATVRAEPFIPYLRGSQPLFHDKFDGPNAYYLYEEVPRSARLDQQKHNPLEVLLDASLKAFGI